MSQHTRHVLRWVYRGHSTPSVGPISSTAPARAIRQCVQRGGSIVAQLARLRALDPSSIYASLLSLRRDCSRPINDLVKSDASLVLDRLVLDDDEPLRCEVERVALGRVAALRESCGDP